MADKLSMDATAALAAGVSYGKYMALRQQTPLPKAPVILEPEKYEFVMGEERVCPVCGIVFPANHPRRKYCSRKCYKINNTISTMERHYNKTERDNQ